MKASSLPTLFSGNQYQGLYSPQLNSYERAIRNAKLMSPPAAGPVFSRNPSPALGSVTGTKSGISLSGQRPKDV